jgi:hypothetical protein
VNVDKLPELKAGIYEHYKGDQYLVIGYCNDSTNYPCDCDPATDPQVIHHPGCSTTLRGRAFVAYVSLRQVMDVQPKFAWHVREVQEFHQVLCSQRGCSYWGLTPPSPRHPCKALHLDKVVPRFRYLRAA